VRVNRHLEPSWRRLRLTFFTLQAAALILVASACGREGRTGDAEPLANRPSPATEYGVNQDGGIGPAGGGMNQNQNQDNMMGGLGTGLPEPAPGPGGNRNGGGLGITGGYDAAVGNGSGGGTGNRNGNGIGNAGNGNGNGMSATWDHAGLPGGIAPNGVPYDHYITMKGDQGHTTQTRVEMSQSIADALTAMDEVRTANVLVTENNAYVAVTLQSGSGVTNATANDNTSTVRDISEDIKGKVADKVKAMNTNIHNVYVSASPDFVERMNALGQDIRNGHPVAGVVKELFNIVDRIFPTRATNNNPAPQTVNP